MYSLQVNAHGNRIVCRGTEPRRSYRVVFVGSYQDCQNCPIASYQLSYAQEG
jgi:hypothetical protein